MGSRNRSQRGARDDMRQQLTQVRVAGMVDVKQFNAQGFGSTVADFCAGRSVLSV